MRTPGRALAGLAGALQLLSAFLAWTNKGVVGLDVPALGSSRVAVLLLGLAALPMIALLVSDKGWPRLVSGLGTAALILGHLAGGPDGHATSGVLIAVVATILHWFAAAIATGPIEVARFDPA